MPQGMTARAKARSINLCDVPNTDPIHVRLLAHTGRSVFMTEGRFFQTLAMLESPPEAQGAVLAFAINGRYLPERIVRQDLCYIVYGVRDARITHVDQLESPIPPIVHELGCPYNGKLNITDLADWARELTNPEPYTAAVMPTEDAASKVVAQAFAAKATNFPEYATGPAMDQEITRRVRSGKAYSAIRDQLQPGLLERIAGLSRTNRDLDPEEQRHIHGILATFIAGLVELAQSR